MKNIKKYAYLFVVFITVFPFTGCYDNPLDEMLNYSPKPPVVVTIVSQTGAIDDHYILTNGNLTLTFSHNKDGYQRVQILYPNGVFYSGNLGWLDYTAGTEETITIHGPSNKTDYYFGDSGTFTVRITGRDSFNNEGSTDISYTVAPSGSYVLSGAGTTGVNGLYLEDTTTPDFSAPSTVYHVYYSKAGNPIYYITYNDGRDSLDIHTGASAAELVVYYYNYNIGTSPIANTDWTISSGQASVPTVTYSP